MKKGFKLRHKRGFIDGFRPDPPRKGSKKVDRPVRSSRRFFNLSFNIYWHRLFKSLNEAGATYAIKYYRENMKR